MFKHRLFINEMYYNTSFFLLSEKDFYAEFGKLRIGCHLNVAHLTGMNADSPVW